MIGHSPKYKCPLCGYRISKHFAWCLLCGKKIVEKKQKPLRLHPGKPKKGKEGMKIGKLEQHCGECGIIEYCGDSFGYCICSQERFKNIDTDTYKKHAKQAKITQFSFCSNCQEDCSKCGIEEEAREHYCEEIAAYVANTIYNSNNRKE